MKYLIGFLIAFGLSMNCQADQNGDSNVTQPVYKILREQEWKEFQSQGHFDGSTDDKKSGFIHLSPANQIERIINKYFATERMV